MISKKKILVVDDNTDFLGIVYSILSDMFEVKFATNAKDALQAITNGCRDCDGIFLDMSLPDYTGYYLAKKIRNILPTVPIAFVTNYDGVTTKENAEEVGASFIYKSDVVLNKDKFLKFAESMTI